MTDIWTWSPHRAIFFQVLSLKTDTDFVNCLCIGQQYNIDFINSARKVLLISLRSSCSSYSRAQVPKVSSLFFFNFLTNATYCSLLGTNKIHLSGKSRYLLFYITYFSNVSREIKLHFPCNFNLPHAAQLQAIYDDESMVHSSVYLHIPEEAILFVTIKY